MSFTRVPVVDISGWFAGGAAAGEVARRINDVCTEVGFLYVAGHGVPVETIDGVFDAARRFFALPQPRKSELDFAMTGRHRGYVPALAEATDPGARPDVKEAFNAGLVLDPGDAPPAVAAHMGAPNLWPQDLPGFRAQVSTYLAEVLDLARVLFEIFAAGFGLPAGTFAAELERPIAHLRLLHYPPVQVGSEPPGIGAHCDYEALTILAQDDVGGLQIRNTDGEWIAAAPIPGTFVVNIGEMLSRWTNGTFTATPHRVVNDSGRPRYSVPFFFATNYDTMIAPLKSCVTADRPARYAPIGAGEYLMKRLSENYG